MVEKYFFLRFVGICGRFGELKIFDYKNLLKDFILLPERFFKKITEETKNKKFNNAIYHRDFIKNSYEKLKFMIKKFFKFPMCEQKNSKQNFKISKQI